MTEAQISGSNLVAPSYTTADIGGSYRFNEMTTLHAGVQNVFDHRLDYDISGYLIDPARLWMGLNVRF